MENIICVKCNFKNPEGSTSCKNCGFHLSSGTIKNTFNLEYKPEAKLTEIENNHDDADREQNSIHSSHDNLKNDIASKYTDNTKLINDRTERNEDSESTSIPESESNLETEDIICINCSYILSGLSLVCPACGYNNGEHSSQTAIIKDSDEMNETISMKSNSNDNRNIEEYKTRDNQKTIREGHGSNISGDITGSFEEPLAFGKYKSTVREESDFEGVFEELEEEANIKKTKVRLEAMAIGGNSEQRFVINSNSSCDKIIVNRGSINADDNTITSGLHAEIYKKEGHWMISNDASNKAVFIQVKDKTVIEPGDIVLFGADKFYMFIDESE